MDRPYGEPGLQLPLAVAILFHLILLFGIGLALSNQPDRTPQLDITLVRKASSEPDNEAEFIAQQSQTGSGNTDSENRLTTDRLAELAARKLNETSPLAESAQKQGDPAEKSAQWLTSDSDRGPAPKISKPGDTALQSLQLQREIASLQARLDTQKAAYSKIPRTLVLTAMSAKASDQADYLYQWVQWVEKIGNENYPEEARRNALFGELQLLVAIGRDGNVEGVEILKSSGIRVLDQAAIRIVRLASPFAPIPKALSVERLEVIRTWRFSPDNLFDTDVE